MDKACISLHQTCIGDEHFSYRIWICPPSYLLPKALPCTYMFQYPYYIQIHQIRIIPWIFNSMSQFHNSKIVLKTRTLSKDGRPVDLHCRRLLSAGMA